MWYQDQSVYLLYDTESPLARILSDAWISVLEKIKQEQDFSSSTDTGLCRNDKVVIREFKNPPQPLYRGGLINPDNPHLKTQNRIITSHNIEENKRVGLDHHEVYKNTLAVAGNSGFVPSLHWNQSIEQRDSPAENDKAKDDIIKEIPEQDLQIDLLKNELISLPAWSIVILVQSTNFRLSTFRIRLELFHLGIHVVEFNHLAYIPETEFDTFTTSLVYQTSEYTRVESIFRELITQNNLAKGNTRIQSVNWEYLTFWPLENIRGNTWDYSSVVNKGGTFPIGEIFTESVDLSSVNGRCLIESYPREDFSVEHCTPFELIIENGRVLPSESFPAPFAKLYNWIVEYEGEVMVRELGMGLNTAITTSTPLSDINFYERKTGVHLSLGKKHGIYGKKLPKTEIQRFHIDVFIALEWVYIGEKRVFEGGRWIV